MSKPSLPQISLPSLTPHSLALSNSYLYPSGRNLNVPLGTITDGVSEDHVRVTQVYLHFNLFITPSSHHHPLII